MEDRASAELGAWQVLQGLADGRQLSRDERRPTGPGSSYEGTKPQRVGREGRSSCRESSAGWGRPGYLGRGPGRVTCPEVGGGGGTEAHRGKPQLPGLVPLGPHQNSYQ